MTPVPLPAALSLFIPFSQFHSAFSSSLGPDPPLHASERTSPTRSLLSTWGSGSSDLKAITRPRPIFFPSARRRGSSDEEFHSPTSPVIFPDGFYRYDPGSSPFSLPSDEEGTVCRFRVLSGLGLGRLHFHVPYPFPAPLWFCIPEPERLSYVSFARVLALLLSVCPVSNRPLAASR